MRVHCALLSLAYARQRNPVFILGTHIEKFFFLLDINDALIYLITISIFPAYLKHYKKISRNLFLRYLVLYKVNILNNSMKVLWTKLMCMYTLQDKNLISDTYFLCSPGITHMHLINLSSHQSTYLSIYLPKRLGILAAFCESTKLNCWSAWSILSPSSKQKYALPIR